MVKVKFKGALSWWTRRSGPFGQKARLVCKLSSVELSEIEGEKNRFIQIPGASAGDEVQEGVKGWVYLLHKSPFSAHEH